MDSDQGSDEFVDADGADVALADVDIRQVSFRGGIVDGQLSWTLGLAGAYPSATTLAAQNRVVEYGIVVDADGDLDPDCQLGINNDTPEPGDFRVWLKNTNTGAVNERVGGPYGSPFDFVHPGESQGSGVWMRFFFLPGAPTTPCDGFSLSANFYAWAVELQDKQVKAVDYAPDAAWLSMRPALIRAGEVDWHVVSMPQGLILVDSRGETRPLTMGAPAAVSDIAGPVVHATAGLGYVDLRARSLHVFGGNDWDWDSAEDTWYWGAIFRVPDTLVLEQGVVWQDAEGSFKVRMLPFGPTDWSTQMLATGRPGVMGVIDPGPPRVLHGTTDYGAHWDARLLPSEWGSGTDVPDDWRSWPDTWQSWPKP